MVNERQGKVYNPRPVYNRKLLRSVIRAGFNLTVQHCELTLER